MCPPLQVGKSLYTTVRELVENSLDSAEGIGELPDINVTMCGSAHCATCDFAARKRAKSVATHMQICLAFERLSVRMLHGVLGTVTTA